MTLEINSEEADILKTCLTIRASVIETGLTYMRASDAIEAGKMSVVRPLAKSQIELINVMDNLREKIMKMERNGV